MGLPRPWDQQWSLRMQQILAFETDLLEYEDLFDNNPAVEKKVNILLFYSPSESYLRSFIVPLENFNSFVILLCPGPV